MRSLTGVPAHTVVGASGWLSGYLGFCSAMPSWHMSSAGVNAHPDKESASGTIINSFLRRDDNWFSRTLVRGDRI